MTRVANRPVFYRTILNWRPSVLIRVGNQVLTFFWRPPCKNTARGHGGHQKKKKKRSTPGFPWVVLHNSDWTVLLQIFSAIAVNFFQL